LVKYSFIQTNFIYFLIIKVSIFFHIQHTIFYRWHTILWNKINENLNYIKSENNNVIFFYKNNIYNVFKNI
jgi:hypothetical protein